ncbi:MAG: metal ABC transporter permease [Halobacteriales archaeon]|nr:metal ABC transporter permease [Halobacteriales archaeon]
MTATYILPLFVYEMLSQPFMQRAFIAGACMAIVTPLVGSFLVHRQMSLIGDTLAHTAFAGVAVGIFANSVFAFEVSPYLTALVVAVVSAFLIQIISEYTDAYGDVSMAIVLSGGFALGTVVISLTSGGIAVSVNQYLFGSLVTVQDENVRIMVVLTAVVLVVVGTSYRNLLYITFDETAARAVKINVRWYNRLLVTLTALVVVAAMQIMGVILVAAMLVVPVAATTEVAPSFRTSVLLAVVVAQASVVVGMTLSYAYGVAAGGTIVLSAIAIYGTATILPRLRRRVMS